MAMPKEPKWLPDFPPSPLDLAHRLQAETGIKPWYRPELRAYKAHETYTTRILLEDKDHQDLSYRIEINERELYDKPQPQQFIFNKVTDALDITKTSFNNKIKSVVDQHFERMYKDMFRSSQEAFTTISTATQAASITAADLRRALDLMNQSERIDYSNRDVARRARNNDQLDAYMYGMVTSPDEARRQARQILERNKKRIDLDFSWLNQFPPEIKTTTKDGKYFYARILNSAELLEAEGKRLSHCIGWAYTPKVGSGQYIAYHIDALHLRKNGFTIGFHKRQAGWVFDQVRGNKNSLLEDEQLTEFCNEIMFRINGIQEQVYASGSLSSK